MKSHFLLLQFLDQFPDPLFRERIMNLSGQHAVPAYSLLEFLALAHPFAIELGCGQQGGQGQNKP